MIILIFDVIFLLFFNVNAVKYNILAVNFMFSNTLFAVKKITFSPLYLHIY